MKPIKINFTDFWENFNPTNNYIFNTLKKYFPIELSNEPDYLFYSCYSNKHYKYNCTKIEFIPENKRPNFKRSDYAISFDYLEDERHLRLPLYVFYFNEEYTLERLLKPKSENEIENLIKEKNKFCCFIVSNPKAQERIHFFHQLSKYKKVDSGGRVLNNIGFQVNNKLEFMKHYKFNIAFENSSYAGYTTEKVLQPKHVNTVPIYWGNPLIDKEMNPKSFINFQDHQSFDRMIEEIIEADQNQDKFINYLSNPIFYDHQPNLYFNEERIIIFFKKIFFNKNQKVVSNTLSYKFLKTRDISQELLNKIKHSF